MKVTSFNPVYGTSKPEEALKFFEALGFKTIHHFKKEGFEIYTLENDKGLRLDITDSDFVRSQNINGMFATRINVDDLDEARSTLESFDGKAVSPVIEEADSREVINYLMPNGDVYSLVHHTK